MATNTGGTVRALMVQTALILCLCFAGESCRRKVVAAVPATPVGGPVVLPAGTVLALIAAETIDSSQLSTNRAYAAVLSRDIKQGPPQTMLPSGSPATLVLMPANETSPQTWQLGLASVMLNGDSFLVKAGSEPGESIGTFLGGVPGPDYSDPDKRQAGAPTALIVSTSSIHINPGSLLTFRLQKEIVLAVSGQ